tara:strand:- start:630 stop:1472 length:843 start_codon:yes stop_codon:yes gene_type:complete
MKQARQSTKRKRSEVIGEAIKEYIAQQHLKPGDRLPQEQALIKTLDASKGTIREALRGLEAQGLLQTRTGPGGGAFISEVSDDRAMTLLGNYFFFHSPTIRDIYEVRKALWPALVKSLEDVLDDAAFERLDSVMTFYDHPPASLDEEREQRLKELEFHLVLIDYCPNPLLALMCRFPVQLLMNLTVCQRIYEQPNSELRRQGYDYQRQLLDSLRKGDIEQGCRIVSKHMQTAQTLMEEREAMLEKSFFKAGADSDIDSNRDYLALEGYTEPKEAGQSGNV